MTELVNEFAFPSGPRISRVNQYFVLLLGQNIPVPAQPAFVITTDPDKVQGNLGNLRDVFGLATTVYKAGWERPTTSSTPSATNRMRPIFACCPDYMTSLAQSWVSNYQFFVLGTGQPFFGTQLVLISRQLQVVAEMVDEVRFVLDSVFLGSRPNGRRCN